MLPEPQLNISKTNDKDEMNSLTSVSVLEWLSDSSVHPRNKVNSFQWFHIPTLLTTHIQSQHQEDDQQPPQKQNTQLLSSLLELVLHILDGCFESHIPIPNKRLLHSSLSQLSNSPSLDPKIKKNVGFCFVLLESVDEGPFAVVETSQLDLIESKDRTIAELKDQLVHQTQLEREKAEWMEERKTHLSLIQSLQKEKEQIQRENEKLQQEQEQLRSDMAVKTRKLDENERNLTRAQQTIHQTKTEVTRDEELFVSSNPIVTFSRDIIRVSGSTVTNISGNWAGCFTKTVSKGIHRLSIKQEAWVMIGVCDAAEYPKYLTSAVYNSPKAAMMHSDGTLYTAGKPLIQNTQPQKGQEWSAEADLEKRTLHFFLDGVQQPHHFINIPVPLVFAINAYFEDDQVEITFWGEEKQSHVTFQGTGHNLG
ncbi:hypothetical protein BLNAU_5858 [Blattamonas nauphoetae]|uniref:Uncharacterized protein n=1 Tax=Blattamonas nauphoetae TaxID=2049346 RepID=A0ABQ9Y5T0_9EUKA|nr:hypothetical protein BLNAU_5858 [Blattamonas nauphoetae]